MSKNSSIMKFGEMLTNAANFYTVGTGPSFAGGLITMDNHQNSTDPLREEFETAISELTPDERAELLKMFRQRRSEKAQKRTAETVRSIGRG